MATTVSMPQLGESVVEGTIAKWLVSEGDAVQEDQALVEITTDKIDTEIPAPAAGVIGTIHVREGQTVPVGTPLCEIDPAGRAAAAAPARPAAEPAAGGGLAAGRAAKEPVGGAAPAGGAPAARERVAGTRAPEPRAGAVQAPTETEAAAPRRPPARPSAGPEPALTRGALAQPGVALDEERQAAARERRARAGESGNGGAGAGEPRPTPVVRKMAAEHGLDLSLVAGTGIGGRVTKQDVLRHLEERGVTPEAEAERYGEVLGLEAPPAPAPPPPPRGGARAARVTADVAAPAAEAAPRAPAPGRTDGAPVRPGLELREYAPPRVEPGEGDRVEPFSKRRRIIAEHMVYSKSVSPHVYTMAEVDMSRVAALREASKHAFREREGVNLTFLHFLVVATVRALREVPRMNGVVGEDALILRRDVHIGLAVDTEQGLVVPVLRDADRLSLRGVAREVEELAAKARDRRLRVEDLQGGTFTISNPGREGNLIGFAVINQPQLGILRMGEIRKRPVVVEMDGADVLAIRPVMLLSLSYDHRVIDGVTGNAFLYGVKAHLEAGEFEV